MDSSPAPPVARPPLRLGVVTGGGDCPGLNAVIRAVAKAAEQRGWQALGILGGFEGLLEPRRTLPLDSDALGGLLVRGGTILGTASRGRFSMKVGHGGRRALPDELAEATAQLKTVPREGGLSRTARALGISFGE